MLASVLCACTLAFAPVQGEADDQYNFIVGLAERGRNDMVVKEAARFLEDYPRHAKVPLARYRLATAYFDLSKFGESRQHLSQLRGDEDFEFAAEVAFRLGQCELERDEHAAAAKAFEAVVQMGAGYLRTPATFLLGESRFRADDFEGAETLYDRVLRSEDAGDYAPDAAHGLAWCAWRRGNHDQAVLRCRRFLEGWPDDPRSGEMHFLTGESQLESGRAAEALASYELVPAGPFHDSALRGAGFACAALENHAAAAARFGQLLAAYPDSRYADEARLHQGIHLLKAEQPAEALVALKSARGAEARYWRARAHAQAGASDKALAELDRALREEPSDELAQRIRVARGDALFDLGRTDEAAEAYEGAGSDYAMHAAAVARLNDGDAQEAVRLARQIVDPARNSSLRVEAQLTLGEALFALGEYEPAEAAFRVVSEEDPDEGRRIRALSRLGWCKYLAGDANAAARRFAALVERHPESSEAREALFMQARASEAGGDEEGARTTYAKFIDRFDDGEQRSEALLRLARLEGDGGMNRFRQLVDEAGDSPFAAQAHYELGERYAAARELDAARRHYAAVGKNFPEDALVPTANYGLAWCHYSGGDHARAATLLRALAADRRADAELVMASLELLVWAERKAGNPAGATSAWKLFTKLCTDEPRRFKAAKAAAGAISEGGDPKGADKLYAKLLETTQDASVAVGICIERAYLALDAEKLDAAETQVRTAYKYVPEDAPLAEAFFFIGEARFELGEDERAAELYAIAAMAAEPSVAQRALYKGGFANLRRGSYDPAVRCFSQLVSEHPNSELFGESLFLTGETHYRAGRYGQAVQWLLRVRKEATGHEVTPKALFRLGLAQGKRERWSEASEVLAELVRRFPDFPNGVEAELWRGRALAKQEKRRGARQAFAKVIENDRGVLAAQARIELGRIALAEGDREAALSEFLRVAVLYAHEEEVAEALFLAGQVLEAQNEREGAIAQYREAVTKYPEAQYAQSAKERLEALGASKE